MSHCVSHAFRIWICDSADRWESEAERVLCVTTAQRGARMDVGAVAAVAVAVAGAGAVVVAALTKYPHKVTVTIAVTNFLTKYAWIGNEQEVPEVTESIAGMVRSVRKQGSRLVFITVAAVGEGVTLQVMARRDNYGGSDFNNLRRLSIGDRVFVTGFPARSKSGQLSIIPTRLVVTAPCLHQLPSAKGGELGPEVRYRRPYLGMMTGMTDLAQTLITRARVIQYIRSFLDGQGFLEVETPILNTVACGAAAKPFTTHHNDLGIDLQMRVAPELFLKTLVVGGFDRVFEIGKQFRNETIDPTHNPEFTTVEFYMAYADYEDMIVMAESLVHGLVKCITGGSTIEWGGQVIDVTPPFQRIPVVEGLEKALGITLPVEFESDETRRFFEKVFDDNGFRLPPNPTTARMIDELVSELLETQAVGRPVFITEHPQIMSPLAKAHRSKPAVTERFELFVMGKELCNAYTEQNDPEEQRRQFEAQAAAKAGGDAEAHGIDEEFLVALEHGLPPIAGLGMGIDRLVMFLVGALNIKDVLAFPPMAPQ